MAQQLLKAFPGSVQDAAQEYAEQQCVKPRVRLPLNPFGAGEREACDPDQQHSRADGDQTGVEMRANEPIPMNLHKKKWQQQIEMLFDGQAPRMLERGACIVLNIQQVLPYEGLQGVSVQNDLEQKVEVIGRPDLQHSAYKKPADLNLPGSGDLLDEQAADQETAEHKKQIDSHPADPVSDKGPGPGKWVVGLQFDGVKTYDQKNGESANPIELHHAGGTFFSCPAVVG